MVRFQFRWINKRYKWHVLYRYKFFFLGFPASLNGEIEVELKKDFEVEYAKKETLQKEVIAITLTRDKIYKKVYLKN